LTAYLTPPNSGSNMHFDSQHVFLLQVAGEKLWRVSTTPAVHAPPNNLGAAALRSQAVRETLRRRNLAVVPPEDMQFAELHVTPGDVLYLPPGTWHEPRTLTRSLHYTLTLFPVSMSQVLLAVLRALMTGESRWRRDLRFTDGANTSEARMLALIREALQELATDLAQVSPESVLRRAFPSGTRQPADGEAEE
jgi:ribosomal protein L16 Arg81 hydroxylase